VAGEIFAANGTPGQILHMSPDGLSMSDPWIDLRTVPVTDGYEAESGYVEGLAMDQTRDPAKLIAVTDRGCVWEIGVVNGVASARRLARQLDSNQYCNFEGVDVLPNDVTKYGAAMAGRIIVADEHSEFVWQDPNGKIYAVSSSDGSVASLNLEFSYPEQVLIIPKNQNLFGMDPLGNKVWGASYKTFAGMEGDLLVSEELSGSLYHARWNGTSFAPVDLF